jgi:mannose-6-phosphate isomerase
VVNGEGKLITSDKEYKIKKGDSFLIPATLGKYNITGNLEFLKSYIV